MKVVSFLVVVSLCLPIGSAPAADFPNASVTDGIVVCDSVALTLDNAYRLRAAGVTAVRAAFYWDMLEGANGPVWDTYDRFVTNCAQAGLRVYANFENTNPRYYQNPYDPNTQPDQYNAYAANYFGSSGFRNQCDHYIQTTVNHYTTLANTLAQQHPNWNPNFTWELWNEPNLGFWPGQDVNAFMNLAMGVQGEQYSQGALQLIRDTAATVSGVAGNPTIVAPGVAMPHVDGCPDAIPYLTTCIQRGLLTKVDAVSVHPYTFWPAPEYMIGYYDSIRSIPGYNGTTPIIDSESGYVSESGSGLGRQTQADYLQRTMLVNFSQGIPLSDWFNAVDISYYDWTFGLFEENGGYGGPWGKPKPTFYAMKTLTSSLQGTKYNRKLPDSNTDHWLTVFRSTTTDRETLAAWTTGNAGTTAVSGWGSYYLNGTPLYVGQSQARAGGDGKWSDNLWGTGSAWVNGSQATFNSSNATITVDGSPTISAIQFGAGNITLSGGALQFTSGGGAIHTQTGTGTINSVIAGGGDPSTFQLRKSGSGTLILGGANTFAGGVIVGQGAIQLGNANALRNNTVTVNATNGLKFSTGIGTFTLGGLAGSSSIALKDTGNTAVALQVGYNNLDSEYSGSLSGVGSLKKIGSGLLTLSGHNNYAGGTTISAGSLRFNSGSTFYKSSPRGANNITIESAGTLLADGDYTSAQAWLGSGKINTTSTGTLALTADSSDAISMGSYAGLSIGASGDYTYSGAMTPATDNKYRFGGGGGTLTVSSGLGDGSISRSLAVNGNVMLSGANSYTGGTTVNRGNLQFAAGSCPSSGSITIKSGGALVANGAYDNAQAWLDSGKIDAANSDGALAIAADTSTVNMTGYNNLSIGSAVAYTINSTITPAGNVFRLGGGGGTLTVSSILRNQSVSPYATRSLVTNGNVALTGVNTYSGVTTVNSGGKLTLNSGGSINNTSGITLQASGTLIQNSWRALGRPITFNGGTFGGTGQFNGNLTVGNGHLSPGDGGVGTLTIAGNVSLGSSSVLDYDFGITAGSCDRVSIIGGSLVLDGTLNVTSDLLTEGAYTIISGASSIIDNGLSFGAVPSDRDWSYSIANDGGVYSVIVMATPEPGTVVLLTTALLSVAAYAWRKRRCGN